jgi:anti-sigma regulatory factor (Ser/Thr protein kinase)
VFARYVYNVDRARGAAFLWSPAVGIVHANVRGCARTNELIRCETLAAAASECMQTRRAIVALAADSRFLLFPLPETSDRAEYVFGIEGLDVADAPRLLRQIHEAPGRFARIVHVLAQISLVKMLAARGRDAFTAHARDDAALPIRRTEPMARFEETLPASPAATQWARAAVRRLLARSPLGTRTEEFVLAIGEAVNNAIEHGSPQAGDRVRLALEWNEAGVHGSVASNGPWQETVPNVERGRGLMVMRAVCDRVTIDAGDRETVVGLHIDFHAERRASGTRPIGS